MSASFTAAAVGPATDQTPTTTTHTTTIDDLPPEMMRKIANKFKKVGTLTDWINFGRTSHSFYATHRISKRPTRFTNVEINKQYNHINRKDRLIRKQAIDRRRAQARAQRGPIHPIPFNFD